MKNTKKQVSNILYVAAYDDIAGFPNPARKVGITGGGKSSPKSRMSTLSNGTEAYSEVKAIQLWKFPMKNSAKEHETNIHNALDIFELRTNREWFNGGSNDENKVELYVELYMESLIQTGINIIPLHTDLTDKTQKNITTEEGHKIKVQGQKKKLPKSVTVNANTIEYNSFKAITKRIFEILIDAGKIRKDMCPIIKKDTNKHYLINAKPEHKNEALFRSPYEYKGLFIDTWASAKGNLAKSQWMIDNLGNKEFILNLVY